MKTPKAQPRAKTAEAIEAGKRIETAREKLGFSRHELSELSKIKYSTLGNYENGLRLVGIHEVRALSGILGLHPAYLMGLLDKKDIALLSRNKKQ